MRGTAIAAALLLGACAGGAGPKMMSGPVKYSMMSCDRLDAEREKVERGTARLFASLRRKGAFGRRDEAELLAMWPTLLFLKGSRAADARSWEGLKREYATLRMVAAERPCPIAFADDLSRTVRAGASPPAKRMNEVVAKETSGG